MRHRKQIKSQPSVLDENKAWLLGHLVGDGGVYSRIPDSPSGGSVQVFAGTDLDIARYCQGLFLEIYGLKSTLHRDLPWKSRRKQTSYRAYCGGAALVEDVRSYGTFGTDVWRVPELVLKGSPSIQGAWISGYFDAEGSVFLTKSNGTRKVSVETTNLQGLAQVVDMLDGLGIVTGSTPRPADPSKNTQETKQVYMLSRDAIERFAVWVGFRSPKKRIRMAEVVDSYARDEDPTFDRLVNARLAGRTVAEASREAGLNGDQEVLNYLQWREAKGHRSHRGDRIEKLVPRMHALRAAGMKWKDVGAAIGIEGPDQKRAIYAINMAQWAKKKGFWPKD